MFFSLHSQHVAVKIERIAIALRRSGNDKLNKFYRNNKSHFIMRSEKLDVRARSACLVVDDIFIMSSHVFRMWFFKRVRCWWHSSIISLKWEHLSVAEDWDLSRESRSDFRLCRLSSQIELHEVISLIMRRHLMECFVYSTPRHKRDRNVNHKNDKSKSRREGILREA